MLLMFTALLMMLSMPVSAVDIFDGGADKGLAAEKELYQGVFGEADKEAVSSRRKRLPFAQTLHEHLLDPEFESMHGCIIVRIKEILEKERDLAAYKILLDVFHKEHARQEPSLSACYYLEEI